MQYNGHLSSTITSAADDDHVLTLHSYEELFPEA